MTKEEKLELELYQAYDGGSFKSVLDEFFKSNVVIPKGVNRHPYADVLHAYAEGIEVETRECSSLSWYTPSKIMSPFTHPSNGWRIKPSDPVYEWQWVYGQRGISSRSARLSDHCTKEELIEKFTDDEDVYFYNPIDETKRERK